VIVLDMVVAAARLGHSCLTAYLSRTMTREETAKLTKTEMKARRLTQTRACRHRQKMAAQLAKVARHDSASQHDAYRAAGRDIIDLSPVILDI
jgi:hypothetical protein